MVVTSEVIEHVIDKEVFVAELRERLVLDMPDAPREHAGEAEGRQEETRQLEDQKKLTNECDQGLVDKAKDNLVGR